MKCNLSLQDLLDLSPSPDSSSFNLLDSDFDSDFFFGKDNNGHVCFIVKSSVQKPRFTQRSTDKLLLMLDLKCAFLSGLVKIESTANVLTCKSYDESDITAFIRLCSAFSDGDNSSRTMTDLFTSLTRLFSVHKVIDRNILNGLFSELFTIYYLDSIDIDISPFWQRKDMMKFDFMLDDGKRVDVKSTTSSTRIHHFKHEQLQYEDYDILICSIMLRESNTGLSLYDMVEYARKKYSSDYRRLGIVENKIRNYTDDELNELCFDLEFLKSNIKFVRAQEIPRFQESNPKNITNAEYDSNLTNCPSISIDEIKQWFDNH